MKFPFPLEVMLLAFPLLGGAQQLSISPKTTEAPEMGTLNYLELRYGGETFSLVPPAEFHHNADAMAARVQFSSRTGSVVIALQFTTNASRAALASVDALRQHAVPQFSDARVLEQSTAYSNDSSGQSADLSFNLHGRPVRCRVAGLPLAHGTVFVVLVCGAEDFKAARQTFSGMLTSFQRVRQAADNR